jgi:hypothetical protein
MPTADRCANPRHKPKRSRYSRRLWWWLTPLGWLGLLVAGFVLVAAGMQLGRAFSDASGLGASAQFGEAPESSQPCGAGNPCFERGRYQPVWL